jgi:hypothetical protein
VYVEADPAPPVVAPGAVVVAPAPPLRRSEEVQGNILAPFNKDRQLFLFLAFTNGDRARAWLQKLVGENPRRIATTAEVAKSNDDFRNARDRADPASTDLKEVRLGVSFTHDGICKLVPELKAGLDQFKAFRDGPAKRAASSATRATATRSGGWWEETASMPCSPSRPTTWRISGARPASNSRSPPGIR